ncbi:MAG: sugar-binding protein [Saccharofermentanales bacterium]
MKNSLKNIFIISIAAVLLTSCNSGNSVRSENGSSDSISENGLSGISLTSDNSNGSAASSNDDSAISDASDGISEEVSSITDSASSPASNILSGSSSTPNNQDWTGDTIVVKDLGKMQLTSYPDDVQYDWAFSVMKMGDIYKMWWTRQSPHDTVWYAESKDLKNWTKERRVLRIDNDSTWIKMHIARPTVVYANSKYYMYLEAPATMEAGYGEYDNNVFLATSSDGINFTMYPNNENPVPVIKQPSDSMNQRKYGVGQPTAFYKDGKFVVYYTDAINGDGMRVATSADGISFGKYESHPRVFNRAAVGVKYNSMTKKYMMLYSVDPSLWNNKLSRNEQIYYMESDDGVNWPYKTIEAGSKNPAVISSSSKKIRGYPDFVTNPQGIVETSTIYATYMEGELAPVGSDWKARYTTWDGHIIAFNPKTYAKKPMILPNQNEATALNLAAYKDNAIKLTKQASTAKYTGTAPKIDGSYDSVWNTAAELKIQRQVANWGMVPSSTTATARLLWDNENLYAYISVKDSKVSYSYKGSISDMWRRDSIDIFVDVPNNHTVNQSLWTPVQYLMSVCANGEFMVKGARDVEITEEFSGLQKSVKVVSGGYIVELKLPWYSLVKSQISENKIIGLDIQINDDTGSGDRSNIIVWNDRTGNSFQWTDVLGDIKLIK